MDFSATLSTAVILSAMLGQTFCDKTTKLLKNLLDLDMGYGSTRKMSDQDLQTMPNDELRKHIRHLYYQLQCSYVHIALHHMRLVEDVLYDGQHLPELRAAGDEHDVSFRREAVVMLATMLNMPALSGAADTMWVFYMYTERVRWYVPQARDDRNARMGRAVHKAVSRLLEEFLAKERCTALFGTKEMRQEPDPSLGLTGMLALINKHKTVARKQEANNEKLGVTSEGVESFTMDALRLNDVLTDANVMRTLFYEFRLGIDWSRVQYLLHGQYALGTNHNYPLGKQIKSLGAYHLDFVRVLKVIMMRIVWKHIAYSKPVGAQSVINAYVAVFRCGMYTYNNNKMSEALTEFADFLDLKRDKHLRVLLNMFKMSNVKTFKIRWRVQNALEHIMRRLYRSRLLKELVLDKDYKANTLESVKKIDNDYDLKRFGSFVRNAALEESVTSGQVLVGFLKKTLDGVQFKMIQSFILVQKSYAINRLMQLENDYIEKLL